MSIVSIILKAITSLFGWAKQRSEVKNAPDVKAAAKAKQEQAQVDQTVKAVAKKDIGALRKGLAE